MELAERLHHIRSSPKLQSQQQSAVVLSAIEDTLRSQNADFTPTSYFSALISLLGQLNSTGQSTSNFDLTTAVVYLLELVTVHVPSPLLRAKFFQILVILKPALQEQSAPASFSRSSISCLSLLLSAQDRESWMAPADQPGARMALSSILALSLDARPKVRKAAQEGLISILQAPPHPMIHHPAAEQCLQIGLTTFSELANRNAEKGVKSNGIAMDVSGRSARLIHSLQLTKTVIAASRGWPSRSLEAVCTMLLTAAGSYDKYLRLAALGTFETLFEKLGDEQSPLELLILLEELLAKQPLPGENQLLQPWLTVLAKGYSTSAQTNPDGTFRQLPGLLLRLFDVLASKIRETRIAAVQCIIVLLERCIPARAVSAPSAQDSVTFQALSDSLSSLLRPKYHTAWKEVSEVLATTFSVFRAQSATHLSALVATVGELRATDLFAGKKEADEILSKAIRVMGPEAVLEILPLNLSNPADGRQGRAWMVPLLRDSVANTFLDHFKRNLIPTCQKIEHQIGTANDKAASVEVKIFETLIIQIWATLPGYCDRPRDLPAAFDQPFAELLSNLLYQKPQLRSLICKALRMLVISFDLRDSNAERLAFLSESQISEQEAKLNIEHLSGFGQNLLAVMFNVYSQTANSQRVPILACIDAFLSISKPSELISMFDRVCGLLDQQISATQAGNNAGVEGSRPPSDSDSNLSHSLMDILVTAALYVPRESYPRLFTLAAHIILHSNDTGLHKKAYKLIPRLANSKSGMQALVDRSTDLQQMLLSSADNLAVCARGDRVLAISTMVDVLSPNDLHFIPSILPEVVLSTKESNERARQEAFDTIVKMGERMKQGGILDQSQIPNMSKELSKTQATLEEYFTMLSAGLAGSTPHAVSATIAAITRALFHFKNDLSDETIRELLQTVSLFFHSPNREVVGSVLGFVKVCIIVLDALIILPRLQPLISSLLMWSKEHKAHFSAKVKHILERMMRRFGTEVVERNTPEEGLRLVKNIRKTRERRKRNKTSQASPETSKNTNAQTATKERFDTEYDEVMYGSEAESSSIAEEEESSTERSPDKQPQGKTPAAFIVEDDDPLDLLDKNAIGNITSTKPSRTQRRPSNRYHNTTVNTEGKLLLHGDVDDEQSLIRSGIPNAEQQESEEGGIDAYVEAIRGQHVAQRGQRGRFKFSNKRAKGDQEELRYEMSDREAQRKSAHSRRTHPAVRRGRITKPPKAQSKFG